MLKLIVSFSRPPALCLLPPASKPQLKDAVKSQGITVLWRGWIELHILSEGWELHQTYN